MVILGVIKSFPLSLRGSYIASADPTEMSTIEMPYFSDNLDIEILARLVQNLRHLTAAPALQKFLQVVDASIIPLITNTNSIVMMCAVAECVADIIREVCSVGLG